MNKKRKILLAVTSLALVAAATVLPITLASAAPQKIYDLTIAPTTLQAGTAGQTLTATFKNAMPSGNSNINSLKLFAQAPTGFVITGATGFGDRGDPGRRQVGVGFEHPQREAGEDVRAHHDGVDTRRHHVRRGGRDMDR